jgi:hypothetical protein
MRNNFFVIDTNTLVSGKDLLELHPFRGIPILTAVDFLNKF